MWYVLFDKGGVVGYTDDYKEIDVRLASPFADILGYEVEVRAVEPIHLDRL